MIRSAVRKRFATANTPPAQLRSQALSSRKSTLRNMEKHGKLDQEHAFRIVEKTWGKDRLNKDCYKKGAKYEGL